jgi:hypothetical protein
MLYGETMTIRIDGASASAMAQLWAARDAEQDALNNARLARWRSRYFRDPVNVPAEKSHVVWVSAYNVEPIRRRNGT